VLALVAILAAPAAGQDAASQLRTEIQRVQASLKAQPLVSPDFANANSTTEELLTAAAGALDAGRLYLSLEKLVQATDFLQGARTALDKAGAVKGGLPAFELEWASQSRKLAALDLELGRTNWSRAPAALRALSEAARVKTTPLLDGSRGFAVATQPKDGLFYLGEAQAQIEFARFCASLSMPRPARPFPLRSLLPELQAVQAKTNAAFQPPRSIDLHSRFIALNSVLKLASELDAAKAYAGALYEYLEASRHYAMLDEPPLDAARQAALKASIAVLRKKLAASSSDDSIAQLFVQRAESQMAHADGSAPTPDEWRSAQVIADRVLPLYFAARKPASRLPQAAPKTVVLTLVRWPYT
jgi:hypothetical protein